MPKAGPSLPLVIIKPPPIPHTYTMDPPDLIKVTSTWQNLSPHLSPEPQFQHLPGYRFAGGWQVPGAEVAVLTSSHPGEVQRL